MSRTAFVKNDFAVVLAVIVVLAILAVVLTLRGHLGKQEAAAKSTSGVTADQGKDDSTQEQKEVTTKSGLKYIDLKVGTGEKAQVGSTVSVEYVGRFKTSGEKFDSSADQGKPLTFTLGERKVIAGWEEGIPGMKIGGKRKLIVPYKLAYGDTGKGIIPPKADLVFEIELLAVKNP